MRSMERPPLESILGDRSPDDLEELLRAFFRSELPHPWPAAKLPAGAPPAQPRLPLRLPSRFLLAASVAFLFVTSLSLSGTFRDQEGASTKNSFAKPSIALPQPSKFPGNVKVPGDESGRMPANKSSH